MKIPNANGLMDEPEVYARRCELERAYARGRGDRFTAWCAGILFGAVCVVFWWAVIALISK